MKKLVFLMIGLIAMTFSVTSSYAEGTKKSHPATPKRAIHELNEAKEVIAKLAPDADGHLAKASASIDQAIQELGAVKEEAKKS